MISSYLRFIVKYFFRFKLHNLHKESRVMKKINKNISASFGIEKENFVVERQRNFSELKKTL